MPSPCTGTRCVRVRTHVCPIKDAPNSRTVLGAVTLGRAVYQGARVWSRLCGSVPSCVEVPYSVRCTLCTRLCGQMSETTAMTDKLPIHQPRCVVRCCGCCMVVPLVSVITVGSMHVPANVRYFDNASGAARRVRTDNIPALNPFSFCHHLHAWRHASTLYGRLPRTPFALVQA